MVGRAGSGDSGVGSGSGSGSGSGDGVGSGEGVGSGIWGVSVEGLSSEVSLPALFSAPVFALAVCGAVSSAQAYCAVARAEAGIPKKASSDARPKAIAGYKKSKELI